jgi:tetratricopeptide (TPR) repeat protein
MSKALHAVNNMIKLAPSAQLYAQKAQILCRLFRYEEGAAQIDTATILFPTEYQLFLMFGEELLSCRQYEQALMYYARFLIYFFGTRLFPVQDLPYLLKFAMCDTHQIPALGHVMQSIGAFDAGIDPG